jgi:hypothetical protein
MRAAGRIIENRAGEIEPIRGCEEIRHVARWGSCAPRHRSIWQAFKKKRHRDLEDADHLLGPACAAAGWRWICKLAGGDKGRPGVPAKNKAGPVPRLKFQVIKPIVSDCFSGSEWRD